MEKNQPKAKIRHGRVNGALFERTGTNGPFLTATFKKHFKSGEEWRESDSYSRGDLDNLILAVTEAIEVIDSSEQGAAVSA